MKPVTIMMEKSETKQKLVLCEYKFQKNLGSELSQSSLEDSLNSEIYFNDYLTTINPDKVPDLDQETKKFYTRKLQQYCEECFNGYMLEVDEIYFNHIEHTLKDGTWIMYTISGKVIHYEEEIEIDHKCDYCDSKATNRITVYPSLDVFGHFNDTDFVIESFEKKPSRKFKLLSGRNWNILSNGWGKDSVYELTHNWKNYDEIIFSDTGSEQPETLDFIKTMMKKLPLEARLRITNLDVNENGIGKNLYDYYYDKKAMPTPMLRDCTGKFKINPIRNYLRRRYGEDVYFNMFVCINYTEAFERMIIRKNADQLKLALSDENSKNQAVKYFVKSMKKYGLTAEQYIERLAKRSKISISQMYYRKTNELQSGVQYMEIKYPLYENKIKREDEAKLIEAKGYPVPTKSGCFCCPYGTKAYYMKLENNHPDLHAKTVALIENSTMKKDVTQAKNGKIDFEQFQKNNGCGCFKGTFEEYTDDDMKRTNKW